MWFITIPTRCEAQFAEFPPCQIVTKKNVNEEIRGSRVWLITGEGKPRTYFLRSRFIVDGIVVTPREEYPTKLLGKDCQSFLPMINLSNEDWFEDFRQALINFRGGLQAITNSDYVSKFVKLGEQISR